MKKPRHKKQSVKVLSVLFTNFGKAYTTFATTEKKIVTFKNFNNE